MSKLIEDNLYKVSIVTYLSAMGVGRRYREGKNASWWCYVCGHSTNRTHYFYSQTSSIYRHYDELHPEYLAAAVFKAMNLD